MVVSRSHKKASMGRRKIDIKPIIKNEARQVCFSKRRAGLFKKAHELSTLCGAQIAIVIFSPADKPFSFGHPSVDSIANQFLSNNNNNNSNLHHVRGSLSACQLNNKYAELSALLRKEKEKKARLEVEVKKYEEEIEGLGLESLEKLSVELERLKEEVVMRRDRPELVANQGNFLKYASNVIHGCIDDNIRDALYFGPSSGHSGYDFGGYEGFELYGRKRF